MYCIKHAQKYAAKPNARTFHVDRMVWVDLDPEETVGRKRSKFVDFRELQFSLGSVRFERLGSLVPASDTRPVSCHFHTLLQTQNLQVDLLFEILNISPHRPWFLSASLPGRLIGRYSTLQKEQHIGVQPGRGQQSK